MKQKRNFAKMVMIGLLLLGFMVPVATGAGKVNINTDSKEQLMTLHNIGDVVADRIIEYRKAHPFETPEDITKVKGVGQKTFESNKDRIVVKKE
ncbi:MAG TPA: helix-hairpin-helix domain-containing protein [Desulfotignum sp.]|nr:helix-hairpin-helix domain-containing protein [Desulfotignum sp.]